MRWSRYCRQVAKVILPGRILIFFALLLLLWAPLAVPVYGVGVLWGLSNIASIVALVFLYSCFIGIAWFWGRWVHKWRQPWSHYGLLCRRQFVSDGCVALLVGFGLVVAMFGLQVLLGWASFYPRSLTGIALEGLLVGLAIGFAEELLFRGWLLAELKTSLPRYQAILWSSLIFAIAHFIKPLPEVLSTSPQFLGLLLLGLILGAGRYISRLKPTFASLALPMGLHAGLVWGYYIVDVGDLVIPSGRVPEWVTGIHGNPLSGALGVSILSCLTVLALFKLRSK
ncbi:abortive phage infection protein [Leptolyngbya sp. Heron Island J]|nr:abortive phage infection protein [Leptolyngbya sp. Heron Island J]